MSLLRGINGCSTHTSDVVPIVGEFRRLVRDSSMHGEDASCHDGHLASLVCEHGLSPFALRPKDAAHVVVLYILHISPRSYLDLCSDGS